MSKIISAFFFVLVALVSTATMANIVPLNIDNNGNILTDNAQIVDVNYSGNGSGGWLVSVGTGLNFEEFYFNYSHLISLVDISISTPGWSLITAGGGGGTAGNFGQFNVKLDGPVSGGTSSVQFEIFAAGLFESNNKGNTFAAKISSQQGGNAGGFVSNSAVSAVSLPGTGWLILSGLAGLIVVSRYIRNSRDRRTMFESHVTVT